MRLSIPNIPMKRNVISLTSKQLSVWWGEVSGCVYVRMQCPHTEIESGKYDIAVEIQRKNEFLLDLTKEIVG